MKNGVKFAAVHAIPASERPAWIAQQRQRLVGNDLLAVATAISTALSPPNYSKWLQGVFSDQSRFKFRNEELAEVWKELLKRGATLSTTNYDGLLEQATHSPTIHRTDREALSRLVRHEAQGILHWHGHYQRPSECVLSETDYSNAVQDEILQTLMKALLVFADVLFIGCGAAGLTDPNFGNLLSFFSRYELGGSRYVLTTAQEASSFNAQVSGTQSLIYGERYQDLVPWLSGFVDECRKEDAEEEEEMKKKNGAKEKGKETDDGKCSLSTPGTFSASTKASAVSVVCPGLSVPSISSLATSPSSIGDTGVDEDEEEDKKEALYVGTITGLFALPGSNKADPYYFGVRRDDLRWHEVGFSLSY